MGSPLSPILAELVLENLVNTVTKNLNYEIPVLRKFVDDFILALPEKQIVHTLHIFNSYNAHLQFTMEKETNNQLPFLDTLVIRNTDQSINTEWFSKNIASGRLLNYFSFHPMHTKMNVARNFIKRVIQITTNKPIDQQNHTIIQHLRQNNYPVSLIKRLLNRAHKTANIAIATDPHNHNMQKNSPNVSQHTSDLRTTTANPSQTEVITMYRSITNIPQLNTAISRILSSDFPQIRLAYRPIGTIKQLLPPIKDPVPSTQRSCVIYSIPCTDCQMCYIGMTRNQLKTRLSGHKSNINKYASLIENRSANSNTDNDIAALSEKTALIQHAIQLQHNFDLTKTTILDYTQRATALPILEMCHITNTTSTVNHRTDVDQLSTTYAGLLHTIKNTISQRNRIGIQYR
ncbi:uncharacterized protein LOC129726638 [Wyeomyia smithii]|uniref:uncharacterized protein LOC129726635 n=1 Tax=Wyeomyia smithii TaxID=174621 RepID=UPI002467F137|nr:uncharacterized protein LOC129726635 [Wyeomyia smithii]XP_055539560.1 uncharacterized protein LOC129726638 [Wyeomyia smithii]